MGVTAPAPLARPHVVAEATSLVAWRPTDFPVLAMLDHAPTMFRCWRELEARVVVAYQVYVPGGSYVELVGDLPRTKVAPCVEEMLTDARLLADDIAADGELAVVATKLGTVYAAWRDHTIVVGRRDDVRRALAATELPAWLRADDLPTAVTFATTAMLASGTDPTFGNLIGVPTTRWHLVLSHAAAPWPARELVDGGTDALERFGEEQARLAREKDAARARALAGLPPLDAPPPPPPPQFTGELALTFATEAAAARAADAFSHARFAIPVEPTLANDLAALPRTVAATTLAVRFDQDAFPGVTLEALQQWLAQLTQLAATRAP